MRFLLLTLFLVSSAASVQAAEWFQHKFGEERAYIGHWLAVCQKKGKGACRLFQAEMREGSDPFFGEAWMWVRPKKAGWNLRIGGYTITNSENLSDVVFSFHGRKIALPAEAHDVARNGSSRTTNVFEIVDDDFSAKIFEEMKRSNLMQVTFKEGENSSTVTIGLKGLRQASQIVEKRHRENLGE